MTLRLAVDRPVHVGKDDVDDVGVVARFAEQGTTTAFAERSCAVVGGAESGKLALSRLELELAARHREPRDVAGSMAAAAHRAVAMATEDGWQTDGKTDRPSEA